MEYTSCFLFGIQSKKQLMYYLKCNPNLFKQQYVQQGIRPYLEVKADGRKRLIEPPSDEIKKVQTQIKRSFYSLAFPEYVFSGVRERSYVGNATKHKGNKYIYKLDLTGFFPSIHRDKVYDFFKNKLETSPDVAKILTNLTTIDIDKSQYNNIDSINNFLTEKGISVRNHLISGAPTSQILSYLANVDMFEYLYTYSSDRNIYMTIYVDDIIFSSNAPILDNFRNHVGHILKRNGYSLSKKKVRCYTRYYPKLVTGVIIDPKGNLAFNFSLQNNILEELKKLKNNPNDVTTRKRLRGLVVSARQIKKGHYNSIYKFAFNPDFPV